MNWYYSENGQQRGPVDEDDLQTFIRNGTIKPDTLLWKSGMAEWQPLTAIPELSTPPPLPHGTPLPGSSLANAGTASNDSQRAGLPDEQRAGPAWEQSQTLGFFKAIWQTIVGALFEPNATFANMKRTGGLLKPWLFGFILMTIGGYISIGYQLLIPPQPLPEMGGGKAMAQFVHEYNQMLQSYGTVMMLTLILIPLLAAIFPFLVGGICHLFLVLWGGANRSFEVTFRVFSYAFGSAALLQIIPLCGGDVYPIWGIVLAIIGLAKAHDTTAGKSTGALLTPLFTCCCLFLILIILAVGASGGGLSIPH